MTVKLTLAENFTKTDEYRMAWQLIRLGYALRYWIYAIIAAALVLFVVCFAFSSLALIEVFLIRLKGFNCHFQLSGNIRF